ncbi:hypothetical protein GGH99_001800, partial [Coemansia sp. RSA 1285]
MESQRLSDDQNSTPPTVQFANMSMMGKGAMSFSPNKNAPTGTHLHAPGIVGALASPESPDNAEFGTDVNSGFDDEGYSHYRHINHTPQQQLQPQLQQQQPGMLAAAAPSFPRHHSENGVAMGLPAVYQQMAPQNMANTQSPQIASSTSSVDDISSGNSDTLPPPRAPGGNNMLHRYSSQPRLSADAGAEFTAIPRPRPGRSGLAPQSSTSQLSMAGGEPNPFLTYARNSIYSSSQTSLARGSIYGMGAGANTMSAKRMSRTLVSGNGNALDMYREAAKKTQDQRIQLEYAKFLLQSIENLEDPVVREDINVTYSIYFPGSGGSGSVDFPGLGAPGGIGSASDSTASLPLGQQATEIDPENREKLVTEAVYWVKHLQRKGNTEASYIAGTWFEKGKYGIPVDTNKAVQLFTYAAKNHHAAAAYKVGVHNEERKSSGRAFSYYQMAAALGDVSANHRMAKVFLEGHFHKKPNIKQALVYLRRSADLANTECPDGALLLAQMYLRDYPNAEVFNHVFYDPEEAQRLLDKASQLGCVDAQYLLGYLFEFGEHEFPV